jgi:hypothetical protein
MATFFRDELSSESGMLEEIEKSPRAPTPHYFGRSVEVLESKGVLKNVEKKQFVSD